MKRAFFYLADFDPLTNKDLAFAEAVSRDLEGDFFFVLAPDGLFSHCLASSSQRLAMLSLALRSNPSFSANSSLLEGSDWPSALNRLLQNGDYEETTLLISEGNLDIIKRRGMAPLPKRCKIRALPLRGEEIGCQGEERHPYPADPDEVRNLIDPCLSPEIRAYIETERLYYVDKLAAFLKSEHRLMHSLSVGNLSFEIARSNGLEEPTLAYVAGVLHDLGKHCPEEEEKRIMLESFRPYADFPPWSFHQFTGAYLARAEFGIKRQEVLEAIESHATGKANMSRLGKIIYSADKIDPLRGYDSSWMIDECKMDCDKGFLTVLRENRTYLTEKGYRVDNPLTKECFEMYLHK